MTTEVAQASRWFLSKGAARAGDVSGRLLRSMEGPEEPRPDAPRDIVIALASELLEAADSALPEWAIGPGVWYLLIADVPVPAVMRLPTILRLHRPDQRLHVTTDAGAVRRLLTARARANSFEGIVDAYAVADTIVVVLGDATSRSLPVDRIPPLRRMRDSAWRNFEIDADGSYLHWAEEDVHIGASQLLQAVDPSFLAEVARRRYDADKSGEAIQALREARGIRQADVPGLSERHVRRIEQGVSRLTSNSAARLAEAFDLAPGEFLDELAKAAS